MMLCTMLYNKLYSYIIATVSLLEHELHQVYKINYSLYGIGKKKPKP